MPQYVENNTIYNYKVDYKVDGEFVTPSSASITLTKNDGTVVGGVNDTALNIGAGATHSVYSFSGANNTATLVYELRYVTVKFVYNSKTYYVRDFYTIRSNLRLPVTPDDVRTLVGMTESELSDEQIDLFKAYSQLQADVTEANLDTILSSGSALIPQVQLGIQAAAALNALIMIETMLLQSEQADNTIYKRFSKVDFESALKRLEDTYNAVVLQLNGVVTGEQITVTSFLVVTGTDPVTNT